MQPKPSYRIASVPAQTYGVEDIARRLGQQDHTPRWHARFVSRLVETQQFPQPFPTMIGERLITETHPRSRWSRVAVDAWFDDRLPPDAGAALDRAAEAEAVRNMDARAEAIGLKLIQGGQRA